MVAEWATLNQAELLENWDRLRTDRPPLRIAPLEWPMHPLVTAVEVIPPYRLPLTFEDGSTGTVDARSWVEQSPGIFAELRDPAAFAKVFVNGESGTIEWPNGADVDPETLYEEAHPEEARRLGSDSTSRGRGIESS